MKKLDNTRGYSQALNRSRTDNTMAKRTNKRNFTFYFLCVRKYQQMNVLQHFSRSSPTILTECALIFCGLLFVLLFFFHLAIVLSVLLRLTVSDYLFGIFKLSFPFWSSSRKPLFRIGLNLDVIRLRSSSSKLYAVTLHYIQDGCYGFWLLENWNTLKILMKWNHIWSKSSCVVSFHNGVRWFRQGSKNSHQGWLFNLVVLF